MKYFKDHDKAPFILVTFAILLYVGVTNISMLFSGIAYLVGIAFPFVLGICLAFIVNVPMRFFENNVFHKLKRGKRGISLIVAFACIVGVIVLVIGLIVPSLVDTIYTLSNSIPGMVREVQTFLEFMAKEHPSVEGFVRNLDVDWNNISGQIMKFLQDWGTGMLNSTFSVISGAVSVVINFVLGLVFAINALLKKETLTYQVKKLLFAFAPEKQAKYVVRVGRLSNQAFSSFLSGQCLEAIILGTMIFVAMKIFSVPYAILIAAFVGVTSLIPIVGGFIGSWVGVFLILLVDWQKAIIFIVIFLVVQQIEGNLIYPHVVGNSVGLPAIWVLVAVTIGGNVAGVVGMIVSIPLCSVVYQLLTEVVNTRLKKRGLESAIRDV